MPKELDNLSEIQKAAVVHKDGPAMIIAGPGSGKTRVIANRVSYLISQHKILPERILAVTFTNKAADEMRDRCMALTNQPRVNVSTFHSLCVSLLRQYGTRINVEQNFSIYDDSDQLRLVKRILKDMNKDPKKLPFKISTFFSEISVAKNNKLTSSEYISREQNDPDGALFSQTIYEIYDRYEKALKIANSLDFDDLLLKVVLLLENFKDVREEIEDRYQYLLVDEFQDTNKLQLEISKKLTEKNNNIFVVGDPDQSIYSWRNAEPRNLLDFEKLFPESSIIKLDQNYRSTKSIIAVADKLISNNTERFKRELWTGNKDGNDAVLITARNPSSEAEFVTRELSYLINKGISPEEIAVMYRVNSQSRSMEDKLEELKIPYRLIGALGFRERREIKDVLAYISVLINPNDEISLSRIINTPRRGISDATYLSFRQAFMSQSQYESILKYLLSKPWKDDFKVNKRAEAALDKFSEMISGLSHKAKVLSTESLISEIIETSGYGTYLEEDPDYDNRLRNIEELKVKAREISLDITDPFEKTVEFAQKFALLAKADDSSESDIKIEKITLITLHQAKGLEYSIVFIIGFEQGMLPHIRSIDDQQEMEEERRLCYVGITRAKERLYLTNCLNRVTWNNQGKSMFSQSQVPSQFLSEIPKELLKTADYDDFGSINYTEKNFRQEDYAKPVKKEKANHSNFSVSDIVMHKVFGKGIVVSMNSDNDEDELLIKFDDIDEPKLILPAFGSIHRENQDNDEDFNYLKDFGATKDSIDEDDFSDYFED